ncbi:hypothetical protein KA005_23290 [bacterium]|nr:hypothetical protein [bacterium]
MTKYSYYGVDQRTPFDNFILKIERFFSGLPDYLKADIPYIKELNDSLAY